MKKKKETAGEQLAPRHASAWQIFCRNKLAVVGLCFILFWVIMAVLAPVIAPYEPNLLDYTVKEKAPYAAHLLGTDQYGRDILTRVLYGARISMWCGVISVGISLVIGTVLGGIAGYYGGAVGVVLMRVMDAMCAFPSLVLAIVIAAAIGKGTVSAMLAVGIVSIPGLRPADVRRDLQHPGPALHRGGRGHRPEELPAYLPPRAPQLHEPAAGESHPGPGLRHPDRVQPELPGHGRAASHG